MRDGNRLSHRLVARHLLALFLALIALGPAVAASATFEKTGCWFSLPRDRDMTCGYLHVPENRSKAAGRTIRLAVVLFEPDRERHEPVVFLTGGPGQSVEIRTREDVDDWWQFITDSAWLRGRRLVVVEQRGVGLSEPALDCSPYFTPDTWNRATMRPEDTSDFDALQRQEVVSCRKALAAKGIDLAAYNSRENAADIIDLRAALGIGKWVVYGVSYGTELGLEVLARDAEGTAAAILDSVLPPGIDYLTQDGVSLDRLLKKLDGDCLGDRHCRGNGRRLSTLVGRIVAELDAQPVLLRLGGDDDGDLRYTRFSGQDFLDILFEQFYDRGAIEALPRLIRNTYAQDYGPLSELVGDGQADAAGLGMSDGMDFSVTCSEADARKPAAAASPLVGRWAEASAYAWVCPLWLPGVRPAVSAAAAAAPDVPVLMLSGEYDPVTPPAWAEALAKRMPRSRFVLFRGIGHDVVDSDPCGADVVADFLADPAAPVHTPCLSSLQAPRFSPYDDGSEDEPTETVNPDVTPVALTGR